MNPRARESFPSTITKQSRRGKSQTGSHVAILLHGLLSLPPVCFIVISLFSKVVEISLDLAVSCIEL